MTGRPGRTVAVLAVLVTALVGAGSVVSPVTAAGNDGTTSTRLSGPDRYATAAAISENTFSPSVDTAFVAAGASYPDALAAGPAAAGQRAPILLTRRNRLPATTMAELRRLSPSQVYVLGGPAVVAEPVLDRIRRSGMTVRRLSGPDRFATGVSVSRMFWSAPDVVYLAAGYGFADALSGGPLAARQDAPLLLARTDRLPKPVGAELRRLDPSRVVLLGGRASLGNGVRAAVQRALPEAAVSRISGKDRYATSAAIARAGWDRSRRAYFATGQAFPDALAGVPAAASAAAPLLLTRGTCLPAPIADRMARLGVQARVLLGGPAALRRSAVDRRCRQAPPPVHDDEWAVPTDARITIRGHGYGHGHGMSQHGAQGAALAGLEHQEILAFYYPGTRIRAVRKQIEVLLTGATGNQVLVQDRERLQVHDLAARRTHLLDEPDARQWRLVPRANGGTRVDVKVAGERWSTWRTFAGAGQFQAGGRPIELRVPGQGWVAYRGALRSSPTGQGPRSRDTVNVIGLEVYLRGVVPREIPALWEPEAVQAQAVAARTYALHEVRDAPAARHYDICDTTSCQVYGGAEAEHPASNAAITATRHEVLFHDGRPAFTQFSASSGGWTSAGSRPYLVAQPDPYDDWLGNGNHDWRVVLEDRRIEQAWPAIGNLQRIVVRSRDGHGQWGGRVQQLRFIGSRGRVDVSGDDVRFTLGLKSTWFSFGVNRR